MTVTGDWTLVEDNENNTETMETIPTTATQSPAKKTAAVRFPCMEQPPRYALRSVKTGIYLGGTKRGRLIGRKRRTEHDEWTIALVPGNPKASQGVNSSTVTIHNHKHGNILSMVLTDNNDLGRMAACVSPNAKEEKHDLGLGEEEEQEQQAEELPGDEDDVVLPTNLQKEDLQWCVVRCSADEYPNGGVVIVSIKTGDCLSVSDNGQIVLSPYEPFHVWEMVCVTGELCFLSNPSMDIRVRCDMAGMLTLSPNWKGWEVVRITEAESSHSGESKGYVRISSWMHSQWFLCSDKDGEVSACTLADALLSPEECSEEADQNYRCSKWAIQESPKDANGKHEGLIIRSVTHGRLLTIHDGLLRTYDTEQQTATIDASTATTAVASFNSSENAGDLGDRMKQHADEMKRRTSTWWKQSLTNVQKTISDSAIQRRNSKMLSNGQVPTSPTSGSAEETIVWQLEAAHLQTYYFIHSDDTTQTPQSIGAFPTVTENLRKSDKIQLVRNDDSPDTLKLYLPDEKFYVKCTSKGDILATKQVDDEGTEWKMEEGEKGSLFVSKAHGLYLSIRTEAVLTPPDDTKRKKNPFENLKRPKPPISELCATEDPAVWNLEPCTPRAISSKRLKTFAIGTSIAVGTTIAMPFAIAGVAAAMGALGAEVGIGFGVVAAAATGAEAIASVGAIGATAYFCFRPEQNSLGDELDESSKASNPWSKRPFGNWRNW